MLGTQEKGTLRNTRNTVFVAPQFRRIPQCSNHFSVSPVFLVFLVCLNISRLLSAPRVPSSPGRGVPRVPPVPRIPSAAPTSHSPVHLPSGTRTTPRRYAP